MTGVPTATLARWADRGLLTYIRDSTGEAGGGLGPRRYWRAEIDLIIVASIICRVPRPNSRFVQLVYRECRYRTGASESHSNP